MDHEQETHRATSGAGIRHGAARSVLFGGRRRSDRWVAYAAITLMAMMGAFVFYTSYQQHTAENERQVIVVSLERQNRDLLCFAEDTQTFELAVTDELIAQQRSLPPSEEREAMTGRMLEVQARLRAAKALCPPPAR